MSERDRISTTANTGDIACPFFIAHGKKDIGCEVSAGVCLKNV